MKKRRKFRADDLATWQYVQQTIIPLSDKNPRNMGELLDEASPTSSSDSDPNMGVPKIGAPMPLPKMRNEPKIQTALNRHQPLSEIDGLARSTRRAIKRGSLEPTARLDLHGLRLEDAKSRLGGFLRQNAKSGHRVVLIVTGKGGHKRVNEFGHEYTGVIRRSFPNWLRSPEIAPLVSHFTPAHVSHGGDGAWYVFIRASARR